MHNQKQVISDLVQLSNLLSQENEALTAAIQKTYNENPWLTTQNYWQAIDQWKDLLNENELTNFASDNFSQTPKTVGIIMAGNIPLVGTHDLIVVLLSGNKALVKPSSEDKHVITYLTNALVSIDPRYIDYIEVTESLKHIDAIIATGSNNSFRYFEHYFSKIPRLLRKNRKSIAVLSGNETDGELQALADDIFTYYGLGCRNVSMVLKPETLPTEKVLDNFAKYSSITDHNKYANNYIYHKALTLMNGENHLDTGYLIVKFQNMVNAPLACLNVIDYANTDEIDSFLNTHKQDIQCIVSNTFSNANVRLGQAQMPDLDDWADHINTFDFLENLTKVKV